MAMPCLLLFLLAHCGYHLLHNSYALFPSALGVLKPVLTNPLVRVYPHYSGGNTAFSFFSPQVASQFLLQMELIGPTGATIGKLSNPGLQTTEGILRYDLFLNQLQHLLPAEADEQDKPALKQQQRLVRAIISNMAERQGIKANAAKVHCTVYVYHHPALGSHGRSPAAVEPIYEKTIIIPTISGHEKISN